MSALHAARSAGERRTAGRAAGVVLFVAAVVAFATTQLLSYRSVPSGFDVVVAVTMCSGVVCVLVPWDRLQAEWLHAIPALGTVEIAVGIWVGRLDVDIAANYYVLVAVFAAYAFSSRREVAAQVALVSVASGLPLLYHTRVGAETAARVVVGVFMVVVVAWIVTLLREGLQKRQRELEALSVRDPLTGIGNYRLLSERLDYEIACHRRSGGSLTVMLLDLDRFKVINDTFGHLVGDRVLIEVARALVACVRSQDTLARQGGDEFSILAPETGEDHAEGLAARARDSLEAATNGSLSTSVGWATFPADGEDAATLLAVADVALRDAKRDRGAQQRQHAGTLSLAE